MRLVVGASLLIANLLLGAGAEAFGSISPLAKRSDLLVQKADDCPPW